MNMEECVFCNPSIIPDQDVILSNDYCLFLQLKNVQIKGTQLEGSGVIVPKKHRETIFDLTEKEWEATYTLLHEVKQYVDSKFNPAGYNLGWNCDEIGGQHINHAHFHIIPRYEDEPLAGKGIRYIFKSDINKR